MRQLIKYVPFGEPTVAGTKGIFCGWTGVSSDGVSLVNVSGANTYSSQHYHAMTNVSVVAGPDWSTYTGYTKGWGSPAGSGGTCSNSASPCKMHSDVRFIRPLFIVNYVSGNGVTDIDSILFTKQ